MARPRRFDEQSLLDAAQEIFWAQGYDRTSIEDVSAASGVGNGSIYSAYGSKLGLFLAVFERYCEGRVSLVETVVSSHRGDFESAVANYLAEIVADCTAHADRRGCLMLNSLAELGSRFPDVVVIGRRSIGRMESILERRVAQGVAAGDIDLADAQIPALGNHIVLVSQGLISLSRVGVPVEQLRAIADTSTRMSALLRAA
ncbi:TetR/AcrR family transcriptional regulator [Amnibacterium flavum]|uniref:TetR/AcrR family transcriptional regulator n=1 Tax=Amnibacterium flavum TaxID=2173173 RepID=A0A2V1HQL5_9MICO|nr:TetR/AcrR family transcriptional regulator [Amnibacterium flavum]PVZ93419.1 TetR/AcrR family transcriptional regulator [Amnibacterium flavum]